MKIFRDLLGIPPPPTPKEIDQGLREIFDFIDSDLKANRDGHMSAKQRYWLVDKFLRKILPPIMITVVYSWFLFVSSNVAPVPSSDPANTSTFALFIWLILVIWAVTAFIDGWQLLTDILKQTVDVESGKGRAHVYRQQRATFYRLVIAKSSFKIPKEAVELLTNDEYYAVYFAPQSKVILSVEVE